MPTFFENFKDGTAVIHKLDLSFMELNIQDETIEIDEDNFDLKLEHGCMYVLDKKENVVNEDLKEHLAEEYNEAQRSYVNEYNEKVREYNSEHKNDEDFEAKEEITFEAKSPEDMIFELDSSYIALTEDGSLNYVPFNHIYHKENKHLHDKLGAMLYEYVVDMGMNMEEAIDVVLL